MTPPTVRVHPAGGESVPLGHDDAGVEDLAHAGYVETELLVSGHAAGAPYLTRALVRHPTDPESFTGVVLIEPMHWAGGRPVWRAGRRALVRAGHAWAEIASQSTAPRRLRAFDAGRYADITVVDGAADGPAEARIGADTGTRSLDDIRRESEAFRAMWQRSSVQSPEIIAQFATALRTGLTPLVGATWVFLGGLSQSGGVVRAFVADHHERFSDRDPVFDGYLAMSSGGDALPDLDVPVIELLGESELEEMRNRFRLPGQVRGFSHRRADSLRHRLYEVAGMAHTDSRDDPPPGPPAQLPPGRRWSRYPNTHMVHFAWDALVHWARDGTMPPPGRLITLDDDGRIARDADGNALGGLRCAHLDVPVAHVQAIAGCGPEWGCGSEEPFTPAALRQRYGSEAAYLSRVDARLTDLVSAGYYLPGDAADYLSHASWTD